MAGSSLAMFLLLSPHFNYCLTALFFLVVLGTGMDSALRVKKFIGELNINIWEVIRLPKQVLQHNITQASPHLGYFALQNCLGDLDSIAFLCSGHIVVVKVISHESLEVDLLYVHDLPLLQNIQHLVDIKTSRLVELKKL
jgi:hypothetical protein